MVCYEFPDQFISSELKEQFSGNSLIASKAKINVISNLLNGVVVLYLKMFLTVHNSNFLAHCVSAAYKLIVDLFDRYFGMKKLRENGVSPVFL